MVYRSSPGAVAALVAAQFAEGVAPAVVMAATATILDQAPQAAVSADARRATIAALVVVTIALLVARMAHAFVSLLQNLVAHRFSAAVDNLRVESVCRLPGLAHFDEAAFADNLHAAQWATQASSLVGYGGYLVQWSALALGAAAVAARVGWWVPLVVAAASVPRR